MTLETGIYGTILDPVYNPKAYDPRIKYITQEQFKKYPPMPTRNDTLVIDYYSSGSPTGLWKLNDTPLTNIDWIESRFNLVIKYANDDSCKNYLWYPFMLQEELFHPSIQANWWHNPDGVDSRIDKSLRTWKTTWTSRQLANTGVIVTCLRDWYNSKGYNSIESFDTFWTRVSNAGVDGHTTGTGPGAYADSKVWAWSVEYGLNLHKAWHIHLHKLGKKSVIIGICGISKLTESQITSGMSGMNSVKTWYYPGSLGDYIIQNYDMLMAYQYPDYITVPTSSEKTRPVQQSINAIKYLRNTLGYKNKIAWFLTVLWGDGNGTVDPIVQKTEFMGVAPFADVIFSTPFAKAIDSWTIPITSANMSDRLITWMNEYNNNLPCQPSQCNFTITQ